MNFIIIIKVANGMGSSVSLIQKHLCESCSSIFLFFCWDVEVNLTFGWKLKIDKVKERSKFRPSAYSEFSIDNKNKEQAGMLPFGGSDISDNFLDISQ